MTNDILGLLRKGTALTLSRIQEEHAPCNSELERMLMTPHEAAEHTCFNAPPAYRFPSRPPSHTTTPAGMFVRIET